MCGGVKEYWIVNPWNREMYIYSFGSGDIQNYHVYKGRESVDSGVLKNLSISLEKVFHNGSIDAIRK